MKTSQFPFSQISGFSAPDESTFPPCEGVSPSELFDHSVIPSSFRKMPPRGLFFHLQVQKTPCGIHETFPCEEHLPPYYRKMGNRFGPSSQ
jgi:hypothetical protein